MQFAKRYDCNYKEINACGRSTAGGVVRGMSKTGRVSSLDGPSVRLEAGRILGLG